jgi:hypothetical protein
MKQDPTQLPVEKQDNNPRSSGAKKGLIASVIINILLLALLGWMWWQLKVCMDNEATLQKEKTDLQSQVQTLKEQLAAKGAAAETTPCDSTITQALKDNIKDAVNSDNTAALEGYMASSVKVIIAASEFGQDRTPAQAITDMNYIQSSSGWIFALSPATISGYLGGSYGTGSPGVNYFTATTYFGKASDDKLVAFNFDSCAKINQVFMSASADLLM